MQGEQQPVVFKQTDAEILQHVTAQLAQRKLQFLSDIALAVPGRKRLLEYANVLLERETVHVVDLQHVVDEDEEGRALLGQRPIHISLQI